MPEALAVMLIAAVCVAAYVAALLKARQPVRVEEELARLREQRIWLENRREMARRENWDYGMVAEIDRQLVAVAEDLDRTARR